MANNNLWKVETIHADTLHGLESQRQRLEAKAKADGVTIKFYSVRQTTNGKYLQPYGKEQTPVDLAVECVRLLDGVREILETLGTMNTPADTAETYTAICDTVICLHSDAIEYTKQLRGVRD